MSALTPVVSADPPAAPLMTFPKKRLLAIVALLALSAPADATPADEPDPPNEWFVEKILLVKKNRRIAVVGHNSTTAQLVNLLLKQSKYKIPAESDYGRVWIVRIKNGKVTDQVISY